MEFLNSNYKKKGMNGGTPGKGVKGQGRTQQWNNSQYQQFVDNAIAQGQKQRVKGSHKVPNGNGHGNGNGLIPLPFSSGVNLQSASLGSLLGIPQASQGQGSQKRRGGGQGQKVNGKGGVHNQNAQGKGTGGESHEEMTQRLNKEALQRADGSFHKLFGSASQVAVYDYDEAGNWVDSKTVGPLFLYARNGGPEYGLHVLNRKGLKNLTMFFDKQSQVIPTEPFLLFRRGQEEDIKCIWFYETVEFHETISLFKKLDVQFDQGDEASQAEGRSAVTVNGGTGGSASGGFNKGPSTSLFDMLKQSQSKVDSQAQSKSQSQVFTAEQLEKELLSGANKTVKVEAKVSASINGISLLQKLAGNTGKNEKEDALAFRLQDPSRAMKTVEQLEKLLPDEEASKQEMSNELLATLGIKPVKDIPDSSSDINSSQSPFLTPPSRSVSDSERSQRKLTIDDLDGKLYEETDEDMVREVVESLHDLKELILLSENVPGYLEPQLVWRKRSNLQNRPSSAQIQFSPTPTNGSLGLSETKYSPASKPSPAPVSPLTEGQLLQALTYLLQTDSSFVSKIHEAYIKSLQEAWGTNRPG